MTTPQPPVGTVAYANWSAQQIIQNESNQAALHETSGWAAVAVSDSTGRWGWACNRTNQAEATQTALAYVPDVDRRLLVWAHHCWIVLLRASGGTFHYGWHEDVQRATRLALDSAGVGATLLLAVHGAGEGNIVAAPVRIS